MEICVLSVGEISFPWIRQGISLFESRLERYIKFTSLILPDIKNSKSLSVEKIKEEEGKLIMQHLNPSDYVIMMDEKGKEYTSREFADMLQKQMNGGRKRLLFVIGGPYGFSEPVYKRADSKISLSRLTFTHEMAKLFLTEQLYRSFTILKGEPYHHD